MTVLSVPPRKLLVVDDEPLVRQTLSYLLRDQCDVTAVASGREAIELCRREAFPVVILDLCMEGLSGIETLRQLKALRDLQNVIILTGYESTDTAIAALNLGAFNYLTKPFERTQLKEVVARGFDAYESSTVKRTEMRARLMSVHDEFFSMLCHEFNTPLNVIMGFSDLLSQSLDNPEHRAWTQHIKESGEHLHEILMEIVDYIASSHLAAVGIDESFSPESVLQPLAEGFQEKDIQVRIQNCLPAGSILKGPSTAILASARKLTKLASGRSRDIELRLDWIPAPEGPEGRLRLSVSGTGIRMNAIMRDDLNQLFEPYRPSEDNSSASSIGLELATCRRIADHARGTVECFFDAQGELNFVASFPATLAA